MAKIEEARIIYAQLGGNVAGNEPTNARKPTIDKSRIKNEIEAVTIIRDVNHGISLL